MQTFRKAVESDIDHIVRLEETVFTDAWTEKSVQDTFLQKQAFIIVAEVDGEFAGYCIVYYVMDEAEIARIAVDEHARRQGLGRGLLDYTTQCCIEKKVERLLLDVRESNKNAIAFYKSYGFLEDGIRKNFYEKPREHAMLMSKDLGQTLAV